MEWLDKTFADALAWSADRHGDREAVVHNDARLTFAQLAERANAFAAGLLDRGIGRGDRIAVWLPDCVEWIVARWAITSIGAILVPINTRFRDVDLGYVLGQSQSSAVIFTPRWKSISYLSIVEALVPDMASQTPGQWSTAAFPHLKLAIGVGSELPQAVVSFDDIEAQGHQLPHRHDSLARMRADIGPADTALIVYTSGTTSFPKGAMIRHGALLQNNFNAIARMGITSADRYMVTSPLFSATGTAFATSTFLAGAAQILTNGFSAESFCALVQAERVSLAFFVEPMVQDIMALPDRGKYDLQSLRGGTGAPLTRESFTWLVQEIGVTDLTASYGLSESSNAVCRSFGTDPLTERLHSNGRPMPGATLRIHDIDSGAKLPPGQVGEIRLHGFMVMAGYYNKPKETAEAIDAEGWLHTGDLGELTPDGRLIFRGRIKEMIKPSGFNVATLEIEEYLKTYPGVKEAVLVGVPDRRQGEAGYAFVEAREDVMLSAEEIIAYCRKHLASYKAPTRVEFVRDWPMTATGKIRKLELKQRATEHVAALTT